MCFLPKFMGKRTFPGSEVLTQDFGVLLVPVETHTPWRGTWINVSSLVQLALHPLLALKIRTAVMSAAGWDPSQGPGVPPAAGT